MTTLFTEIWFWWLVSGLVTSAILGWTARYTAEENGQKVLRKRLNRGWRERIELVASVVVYAIIWAEIILRSKYGMAEPLPLRILTDKAIGEVPLYSACYFTGYNLAMMALDYLADALRIGIFQRRREAESLHNVEEYLEEYQNLQEEKARKATKICNF